MTHGGSLVGRVEVNGKRGRIVTTREDAHAWRRVPWGYVPVLFDDGPDWIVNVPVSNVRRLDVLPGDDPSIDAASLVAEVTQ